VRHELSIFHLLTTVNALACILSKGLGLQAAKSAAMGAFGVQNVPNA
jgi:hypothetical protein